MTKTPREPFFPEPLGSADGRPAGGERWWQVRRIGGIHGNNCQGLEGRYQQYRMTGRQRAAGPDERMQRENLASPVQVGPPVTDQSAGSSSTVCPAQDPRYTAGSWAGHGQRPAGTRKLETAQAQKDSLDRAKERGEREASVATEERNSADCTESSCGPRRHAVRDARGQGFVRTLTFRLGLLLHRSERGAPAGPRRRRGEAVVRAGARGSHAPRRGVCTSRGTA